MARDSGKIKTEKHEIKEDVQVIAGCSGIGAVVFGGIGLLFGPVWAAWGAVGGGLLVAIVVGGLYLLATNSETDEDDDAEGPSDENGYRHGLWTTKYASGNPKWEVTYVHGARKGPFTSWYENGQKTGEGTYQNGKLHGQKVVWYENGQKRQELHCVEGELKGPRTHWYESGQKCLEATHHKEDVYHGDWNEWHENGQKWIEAAYVYGTPQGTWTEWDAEGHVIRQTRFAAGVQFGRGTRFFSPPLSALSESMTQGVKPWRKLFWLIVLALAATAVWRNNEFLGTVLLSLPVVILVHELGHFLVAKLVGIPIQELVVGFGPRLIALLWGHTRYELRLIPLFGYVSAYAFRSAEFGYYQDAKDFLRRGKPLPDYPSIDAAEDAKDASEYASRPGRLAYALGGVTFNLIAAILFAWSALAAAPDEGDGSQPLDRGPLTAAKLVVDQASHTLGTFLPFLRETSPSGGPRPTSVIWTSLGSVGGMVFFFSVFLSLVNLLPIPPLDGFRALQVSIEMVLRREIPQQILQPVMIAGVLLVGVLVFKELVALTLSILFSVFHVDLEKRAEMSHEPTEIVGQPTGAVVLERQLGLFDNGFKDIEPKAGKKFIGLRFHVEGKKILVAREYPVEDRSRNRYQPLGAAFGKDDSSFWGGRHAQRIELSPPLSDKQRRDVIEGSPRKGNFHELGEPQVTLLYEVPEDATQFELQHHSLRHTFTPVNGDAAP